MAVVTDGDRACEESWAGERPPQADVLAHGASHVQGVWVRGLGPQLGGEGLLSTRSSLTKFSPGS